MKNLDEALVISVGVICLTILILWFVPVYGLGAVMDKRLNLLLPPPVMMTEGAC